MWLIYYSTNRKIDKLLNINGRLFDHETNLKLQPCLFVFFVNHQFQSCCQWNVSNVYGNKKKLWLSLSLCRSWMAFDKPGHPDLYRVFRDPQGDGSSCLKDPVSESGQSGDLRPAGRPGLLANTLTHLSLLTLKWGKFWVFCFRKGGNLSSGSITMVSSVFSLTVGSKCW